MLVGAAFEVVVIFVFFEAVPKNWAVHNPERAALLSAPIVTALVRFPPIRVVSSLLIGLANLIIGRSGAEARTASGPPTSPTPSSRPWPTWPTRRT